MNNKTEHRLTPSLGLTADGQPIFTSHKPDSLLVGPAGPGGKTTRCAVPQWLTSIKK